MKVLKRNAYGYRDFNRFRNCILHMFSLKSAKKYKTSGSLNNHHLSISIILF
nr:hypothetical protein [Ruminococcus bromii]